MKILRETRRNLGSPPTKTNEWYWLASTMSHPHLERLHEDYVTNVSSSEMAIGLQTANLLTHICEEREPSRILDLGSGFSSVVFRLYAASQESPPLVISVDDDGTWLDATRKFLEENDLDPGELTTWNEFQAIEAKGFDLVLHDLGNMETRAATLSQVTALLADHGLLVVDDVHKRRYRKAVRGVAAQHDMAIISLRDQTLDDYGRFAALLVRRRQSGPFA